MLGEQADPQLLQHPAQPGHVVGPRHPHELVVETVATILRAALEHGATRVSVQVETTSD